MYTIFIPSRNFQKYLYWSYHNERRPNLNKGGQTGRVPRMAMANVVDKSNSPWFGLLSVVWPGLLSVVWPTLRGLAWPTLRGNAYSPWFGLAYSPWKCLLSVVWPGLLSVEMPTLRGLAWPTLRGNAYSPWFGLLSVEMPTLRDFRSLVYKGLFVPPNDYIKDYDPFERVARP
jgi:hypothetical protein